MPVKVGRLVQQKPLVWFVVVVASLIGLFGVTSMKVTLAPPEPARDLAALWQWPHCLVRLRFEPLGWANTCFSGSASKLNSSERQHGPDERD